MRLLSVLVALGALTRDVRGLSSGLTPVEDFTTTSGSPDVSMFVYRPEIGDAMPESPAIVVAIHSCERTAQYYFQETGYAALADQHGYMVIYPNASRPGGCWHVS